MRKIIWTIRIIPGRGDVINQGTIQTAQYGNIYLLGGNVSNSGTLTSEEGKIILSGGETYASEEELYQVGDTYLTIESVTKDHSGNVTNTGNILCDIGTVGLYGKIVRHEGLIRSLSTVRKGSVIELVAL